MNSTLLTRVVIPRQLVVRVHPELSHTQHPYVPLECLLQCFRHVKNYSQNKIYRWETMSPWMEWLAYLQY